MMNFCITDADAGVEPETRLRCDASGVRGSTIEGSGDNRC